MLWYAEKRLEEQLQALGLGKGSRILMYQDEDDFQVEGVLDFRLSDLLGREAWCADPDDKTLVRFDAETGKWK